MKPENFENLLPPGYRVTPPKRNPWSTLGRVILWTAYAVVAVFVTFWTIVSGNPWVTLAFALAFIFGPKLWRSIR